MIFHFSVELSPSEFNTGGQSSKDSICFRALLDHHGPRSRFEKQNSAKAVSCSLSSFPLQVTIIKDHHYTTDPATDSRLRQRDTQESIGVHLIVT